MKFLSIGDLARRSGVKVTTIRYYERTGLIAPPERSAGGQRLYTVDDVKRLAFIRHSRHLGFPLSAIGEMLQLQINPQTDCTKANEIADTQLISIRERIEQLKALEAELARISDSCRGGIIAQCNVIEALTDYSQSEAEGRDRDEER